MNEFYPEIEPYDHCLLDVGHGHQIYVEQCGNPEGQAVLFVHGGPGGGCSKNDRRFFDPNQYRIILFDQRGCGRSKPHGLLENNTTALLVEDIELIREKLAIDRWHLFGGSWGSTLSLVYAQANPDRVKSLVLRGIFLGRQEDTHWLFEGGGASRLYPDYWQDFMAALPPEHHKDIVKGAYDLLTGQDKEAAMTFARAWALWEVRCCTLVPSAAFVSAARSDASSWTVARHEAHFMVNNNFLEANQILNNCERIKHIPTTIVHGRYDVVCCFDNAWHLHQSLPGSELMVSETAGHTSAEPGTKDMLISATNKMLGIG